MDTMNNQTIFSADILKLDAAMVAERIVQAIRTLVLKDLRRKGAVLGLSGGIDSSVVAALSVRALGADRVLGLLMPERDSSEDSVILGRFVGDHLGIKTMVEDITAIPGERQDPVTTTPSGLPFRKPPCENPLHTETIGGLRIRGCHVYCCPQRTQASLRRCTL